MRVLLHGFFGLGNLGDEAILHATFRSLCKSPRLLLSILSASPERTSRRYGVPAYPRALGAPLIHALRRSDVLCFAGGSLLQDATSLRSLLYYFFCAQAAQKLGKRVFFLAQGLGPLRRRVSRALAASALSRAYDRSFRDEQSLKLAQALGAPGSLSADPALLLEPEGALAGPLVIAPRRVPTRGFEVAARFLADEAAAPPLLVASLPREDAQGVLRLAAKLPSAVVYRGNGRPENPLRGASIVLTERFHAALFALRAGGVPVSFSRDPKVVALFAQVGLEDALLDPFLPYSVMRKRLRQLPRRAPAAVRRRVEDLVERARTGLENARRKLGG